MTIASQLIKLQPQLVKIFAFNFFAAGPSSRAVEGVGLRQLVCCDRGFESHPGHGFLSVVSVVCCQVEVSATD